MTRLGRLGRRADRRQTTHERARTAAAERLVASLSPAEAAWLDAHLTDCPDCRGVAEAYAADRVALRQLRDVMAQPPRDLWARTAAGIEREAAADGRSGRSVRASLGRSPTALTAMAGLAVVAVVLVATAWPGGFFGNNRLALASNPPGQSQTASLPAGPTAIAVGAGEVRWLGAGTGGGLAYNVASINAVCPVDRQPDCAPFADGHARRLTITATPKFIFQSPVKDEAVVVGTDEAGADAVIVVALPTPEPAELPAATSTPESSVASLKPTETATPEPLPSATPTVEASATTAVAIISNVTVVGRGAGYSADGAWFAFSARPADGSAGPDIYVWHVGDPLAVPLTSDHASVFASWVGSEVLGSRITTDTATPIAASPPPEATLPPDLNPASAEPTSEPEFIAETFLIDPSTNVQTPMLGADWQPVIDPTGVWVVAWEGTVRAGSDGWSMVPATGRLVIHAFEPLIDANPSPLPSTEPSPTSASPSPALEPQTVAEGPIAGFDARWDDTGTWLAVWLADPVDPSIGRLSLLHVDPTTGLINRPLGAPVDVPALPGFSMGAGRLAWAAPPGQGGEGSRIQIVAWTEDQVGAVESVPVEGAIVVQ